MSKVLQGQPALDELHSVADFFETYYPESGKVMELVEEGRLSLDSAGNRVVFKFKKPVERKTEPLEVLRFRALTVDDSIRINEGFAVSTDGAGKQEFRLDMGALKKRTLKALTLLSSEPVGILGRMGRSDFEALGEVLNFLD